MYIIIEYKPCLANPNEIQQWNFFVSMSHGLGSKIKIHLDRVIYLRRDSKRHKYRSYAVWDRHNQHDCTMHKPDIPVDVAEQALHQLKDRIDPVIN